MSASAIINSTTAGYQNTTSVSASMELLSANNQLNASISVEETESAYFEQTEAAYFEHAEETGSPSYADKVSSLLAESNQRIAEFKNLFARLLNKQAESFQLIQNSDLLDSEKLWSKDMLEEMLKKATPEDVAAAKEAIAEGGYYSVQSVTDRIMSMAESLAAGDPSKIGILRNAVIAGFEQAGQIFGAELPEISQQTYDSIMARFDAWEGVDAEAEPEAVEA